MLPVIALVGRPNVGKSTLFNVFTRSRDALVANIPGVTRDRQYGRGQLDEQDFIVIDTGGIADEDQVDELITQQVESAVEEATALLFVVDGKTGLTPGDEAIAQMLRQQKKPVILAVNKTDGQDADTVSAEFYQLGFEHVIAVAASHKRGTLGLLETILGLFPKTKKPSEEAEDERLRRGVVFALVGRPNVGKSTLTNRVLGENRVLALDQPGTTTDSVFIPFERHGKEYTIVDTAGVRRRGRVTNIVEKFSVVKTLQAIEQSDVVICIIDAQAGVFEQDLHLIGYALQAGRSVVLAVNKWDRLSQEQKDNIRAGLSRRLGFVSDFVELFFISAEHGTGVGELFPAIGRAYDSAKFQASASQVTHILESAVMEHPAPVVRGRRIKPRYAHWGGQRPPVIVIHGSQVSSMPKTYQRYLINQFRKAFKLVGTPIRLELVAGENPYADKKNKLTPRQQAKKKRLMKFVKKKSR